MQTRRLLLFGLLLLAACVPPPAPAWTSADLRWLGPADAADPTLDLTAVYVRDSGHDVQFRLDLLDISAVHPLGADVYLAVDVDPGRGAQDLFLDIAPLPSGSPAERIPAERGWDWLLILPAAETPRMASLLSPTVSAPAIPRIVRDPVREAMTISVIGAALPEQFAFQVFVTAPGQHLPADASPVLQSDGPSPPGSAPVLLAFHDVMRAGTPAAALRAWDGAHSGPRGTRHGLRRLLELSQKYRIPLTLLDLKTPEALAMLDLVGGTQMVRALEAEGLLLLPEVSEDERDLAIARAFGFEPTSFLYDPQADATAPFQFSRLNDAAHLLRAGQSLYIPLAANAAETHPDDDGLPLAVRRDLLALALSADPADLLVLGGSLPESTWGSPEVSEAAFAYLAARPYILPLHGAGLERLGAREGAAPLPAATNPTALQSRMVEEIRAAPPNALTGAARRAFLQLSRPARTPEESAARARELGRLGALLAAARWAADPAPQRSCDLDLTYDGRPDCVLASSELFAVFESDGARLVLMAAGEAQLIGPSGQLAVDPADPDGLPGAFVEPEAPFLPHRPALEPDGRLVFTAADGSRIKTFRLVDGGLEASYQTTAPETVRLALIVAPGTRFRPGWAARYGPSPRPDGVAWTVAAGPGLEIRATAPVALVHFADGLDLLTAPEDPNRSYPPGFRLPVPLAMAEIRAKSNFTVRLTPLGRLR